MTDESLRRADELLSELIETVETARAVPMSASCVLPRERLLDLLDELREVLPAEMDQARTIVARRDKLLQEAYEKALATRDRGVAEADTVLADAGHRAEAITADAEQQARETVHAAQEEHGRLIAAITVHQAAAQAAAALRDDADQYQRQVSSEAQRYDQRLRTEAERYATKLSTDAENYAERTLDELAAVLHRSAATAEQGRSELAARRASAWTADGRPDDGLDAGEWSPISA